MPDVVLGHVTASDGTIRKRMKTIPHAYQIIKEQDITEIKSRFQEEIEKSPCHRCTIILDTTDKISEVYCDEFLQRPELLITAGELAMRSILIPEGDHETRYENWVRKMNAQWLISHQIRS